MPSKPTLVYRTSTTPSKQPIDIEELQELRPVVRHKIASVWDDLAPKVYSCLDSLKVNCTGIDIVSFAMGPPVVWIGVRPQSLFNEDAYTAAIGIHELLKSYELSDVEIEFREAMVFFFT